MNRSKFFEVLLYSTGTGLGLIINLVTGDMGDLYQENKTSIQVAGAILFGLGLIISIFKESESNSQQGNKPGVSALSIIGTSIVSTALCTIYGLIAGIVVYWGLFFIAKESTQQPEIANFLNSGGFLRVVPAVAGAIIGYFRFKYVYGNETTGVILGAFLGYAASFYVPEEFSLPFLPSLLSHPSIVISTILGGSIGAFSGVFEEGYNMKIRDAENAIALKIEQFEDAVAILRNKGYDVYVNDFKGKLFTYLEKLVAAHPDAKNDPNIRQEIKAIKQQLDADPRMAIMNWLFSDGNENRKVPEPPYFVFNNRGDEFQKFTNTASLYRFATSIDGSSKLLT